MFFRYQILLFNSFIVEFIFTDLFGVVPVFAYQMIVFIIDIAIVHFDRFFLVVTVHHVEEVSAHAADSDHNRQNEQHNPDP